jgi:hypothetical protein
MMLTVAYANLAGGLGFTMHNVGDFALGVEQHLGAHHGVLVEGTFVHVHGNPTHATTFGGQAGWRYHGQREESSPFFGVLAGYEQGFAVSVVPHVGYRWNLGKHAAITARFGGGYGDWRITPEGDATQAPDEALGLLRDRLQFTPVKLDSELSVGVRF